MDRACELEIVNTSLGGADQIIGQRGVNRVELPSDLDCALDPNEHCVEGSSEAL